MSTTVYTVVDCACCGGTGGKCGCSGTGTDANGTLADDLFITLGNNSWGMNAFFEVVLSGNPYCDCIGQFPVVGGSADHPPLYQSGGTALVGFGGTLTPKSYALTWDPTYVVTSPGIGSPYEDGIHLATGAWVSRNFGCSYYYEFRIVVWCEGGSPGRYRVELIWLKPNAAGTGTSSAGDPVEVYGWIWAYIELGPAANGNTNTCQPTYLQYGDLVTGGSWAGDPPDQTPTGNVIFPDEVPPRDIKCQPSMWAVITA